MGTSWVANQSKFIFPFNYFFELFKAADNDYGVNVANHWHVAGPYLIAFKYWCV